MKTCFSLALAGVAIGFALPTFAQQKDTVDPQIAEQLSALSKTTDEAYNNGDAAAMAALYTEDAVLVTDKGPIYGREAIEKLYARLFQVVHFANHTSKADRYFPHIIGTAGNEVWSNGEWNTTLKVQNFVPEKRKGY